MKRIALLFLCAIISLPVYAVWVWKNNVDGGASLTDGTTDALSINSSGAVDFGALIDLDGTADGLVLDADADTTISAPTDDQIDIELKSVDHVVLKAVAVADSAATTNIGEIAFTTPVDTVGTNIHQGLVLDAEIGNASGGTNTVNLLQIDALAGDAQVTLNAMNIGNLTATGATETAITVGTGWDVALQAASGIVLDDGTTDSPSMTFQDATNETAVFAKTDAGDLTLTTDASDGLTLLVGDMRVGNGTPGTASMNGEDMYVEGELEVDGSVELDGAVNIDGAVDMDVTLDVAGAVTYQSTITSSGNANDVTLAVPTNGGNANVQNQYVGVPKIVGWSVGASVNGTTNTVTGHIDETPAGEWVATANVTSNTDATEYRKGTASLELVVGATPAAGNGADNTLGGGDQNWTDDESVGMWMMCTATTTAGDWVLEITDSVAGATTVNFPALGTANKWTWVEVDISGVANASKDVITTIGFDLSAAGATSMISQTCNFDLMYKWDGADEEALSQDVYEDGVVATWAMVTATGGNRIPVVLAEGTDYLIHYEAGNDFFIAVTDQSSNSVWGMAALE